MPWPATAGQSSGGWSGVRYRSFSRGDVPGRGTLAGSGHTWSLVAGGRPPDDPMPWKVSYEVSVARRLPGALMDASLLAVLNDAERSLAAETDLAKLATLDEDAAIELETRVR